MNYSDRSIDFRFPGDNESKTDPENSFISDSLLNSNKLNGLVL